MAEDKTLSSVSKGTENCCGQYDSSINDSDLCVQCGFKCIQGCV
ncbi:hypothetical protein [Sporolituus thermophilus]|nr:hypothetical protein [Sporolituus thermophilus]